MEARDEAELVTELARGSNSALAALFDRHADAVYGYAFRRTASCDLAEEAVSLVFLEAWRGRQRVLVVDASVRPWLFGIATNVCRNLVRRDRRQRALLDRLPLTGPVADHAEDVASRLDDERRMAGLLREIRHLPRRDQDVLALVVWSGMSYEQAAAALGVPVGTVRSRLSRARHHLKDSLTNGETA